MTIQNTFYTAENTENWFLVEVNDNLPSGILLHPILQWKVQGLDAPAIPVTIAGGPSLITRSTDWFVWNSVEGNLYGMSKSGCWFKRYMHKLDENSYGIVKEALRGRVSPDCIWSVQEDNYIKENTK